MSIFERFPTTTISGLRIVFEEDPEDLKDLIDSLELPQKRLIVVPVPDRQDAKSDQTTAL